MHKLLLQEIKLTPVAQRTSASPIIADRPDIGDYLGFDLIMDDNLPEPSVLLEDRGYDFDKVRETMEARNVAPVIPMRKSRKLRVAVERTLYRLRNLIERCFNQLKNARDPGLQPRES